LRAVAALFVVASRARTGIAFGQDFGSTPIAIAVFTVDKRTTRGEVEELIGRLARVVYDFFDAVK